MYVIPYVTYLNKCSILYKNTAYVLYTNIIFVVCYLIKMNKVIPLIAGPFSWI